MHVRSVDRRTIGDGNRGVLTARVQQAYEDAVYARNSAYRSWLTKV